MNQFKKAEALGKEAEEAVADYYRELGANVVDVRSDPDEQRRDVDFLVDGVAIDVKRDDNQTGNLFLEDGFSDGRLGCFWLTRAELWVYVVTPESTAYVLHIPTAQRWLARNAARLRRVKVRKYREGISAECWGYLVPISLTDPFQDEVFTLDILHISES